MIIDKHFQVEVISQMPIPQRVIYAAMHQDYSEKFVWDELTTRKLPQSICQGDVLMPTLASADSPFPVWNGASEEGCGEIIIDNLLKGGRGHYGPLEHAQIVFNVGWFPHSTMQQIRTHRVGVSFDVQSFRYTGSRIANLGEMFQSMIDRWANDVEHALYGETDEWCYDLAEKVESVFYLRPIGEYIDRQGKKYTYSEQQRQEDIVIAAQASVHYNRRVNYQGFSEEHARGLIPFDVRQHWVMSANVRSLMHLLDLRWKKDAQLEAQQLCDLIWPHFEAWVPEVAQWYKENRAKKARLAP